MEDKGEEESDDFGFSSEGESEEDDGPTPRIDVSKMQKPLHHIELGDCIMQEETMGSIFCARPLLLAFFNENEEHVRGNYQN